MFETCITATLKRVLFGMIALALVLAPVQVVSSAKADVAMTGMAMTNMAMAKMTAMTKTDCPQKKNCCDKEKSGCLSPQSCMVECSASFVTLNSIEVRMVSFDSIVPMNSSAILPDSTAPPPLRRPPRI